LGLQGFDVMLIGRKLPFSPEVAERNYKTKRFNLWFHKGPLFYAAYNIRLFLYLLFNRADVLFSNDLDTLPANYLIAKLKGCSLVYDSHEYYTGVPELENRPLVKGFWKFIERRIFPRLKIVITVNDSIAELYEKEYGKRPVVIRNVPVSVNLPFREFSKTALRNQLGLPVDRKIFILQGAGINVERGAEEALEAMRYIDNALLIILGGGDVMNTLQNLVERYHLEHKVLFVPRMAYDKMMLYTAASDLGLSLDKNTNLNYRFSLPNKIFDYIQAGIPVLASRLPEVEKIIAGYDIGNFINSHDPEHIADRLNSMLSDSETLARWLKNLQLAAIELNWEKESEKFPDIIHELR